MVAPTPRLSLEEVAVRSDNPFKRSADVICVLILQLLALMVLADEKDPRKRRTHPVLAPTSLLSRLDAGDDFGLAAPFAATVRFLIRRLRAEFHLGREYIDHLNACPAPRIAARSLIAARRRAASARPTPPQQARQPQPPPHCSTSTIRGPVRPRGGRHRKKAPPPTPDQPCPFRYVYVTYARRPQCVSLKSAPARTARPPTTVCLMGGRVGVQAGADFKLTHYHPARTLAFVSLLP